MEKILKTTNFSNNSIIKECTWDEVDYDAEGEEEDEKEKGKDAEGEEKNKYERRMMK